MQRWFHLPCAILSSDLQSPALVEALSKCDGCGHPLNICKFGIVIPVSTYFTRKDHVYLFHNPLITSFIPPFTF